MKIHYLVRGLIVLILLIMFLMLLQDCKAQTPTQQAYNIQIETPSGGGCVGYCYEKGNGEFRLVVINPYHEVNVNPVNGSFIYYDGAGSYANGYDLGDGNIIAWINFDSDPECNFVCDIPQFPVYMKIFEFNYDFENDFAYYNTDTSTNNPKILP